jgi:hypothetical protein
MNERLRQPEQFEQKHSGKGDAPIIGSLSNSFKALSCGSSGNGVTAHLTSLHASLAPSTTPEWDEPKLLMKTIAMRAAERRKGRAREEWRRGAVEQEGSEEVMGRPFILRGKDDFGRWGGGEGDGKGKGECEGGAGGSRSAVWPPARTLVSVSSVRVTSRNATVVFSLSSTLPLLARCLSSLSELPGDTTTTGLPQGEERTTTKTNERRNAKRREGEREE